VTKISYQPLLGAIIAIFGFLLLLRTTGIYDTGQLLLYIPSLFILLGLYMLWRSGLSNLAESFIFIIIFGTIQLLVLGFISWDTITRWWPLLIVLAGIGILVNRTRHSSPSQVSVDKIDMLAIFGSVDAYGNSDNFRGGDITAIFGESKLDLKDSIIESHPAEINILVLFGEVGITVPDGWQIQMDVVPILGDAEDKRQRSPATKTDINRAHDLKVTGIVAFGSFSIKD
jgi:predicted membrane protein